MALFLYPSSEDSEAYDGESSYNMDAISGLPLYSLSLRYHLHNHIQGGGMPTRHEVLAFRFSDFYFQWLHVLLKFCMYM